MNEIQTDSKSPEASFDGLEAYERQGMAPAIDAITWEIDLKSEPMLRKGFRRVEP